MQKLCKFMYIDPICAEISENDSESNQSVLMNNSRKMDSIIKVKCSLV